MTHEDLLKEVEGLTSENEKLHEILSEVYYKYSKVLMEDFNNLDMQEAVEIHSVLRMYNKQLKSNIQQLIGAEVSRREYALFDYVYDPCRHCCKSR